MTHVTEIRHGQASERPAPKIPGLVVIYAEKPGAVLPPPKELRGELRIGRDASACIQLDDSQVSRLHASIAPTPHGFVVSDLNSRNGTFVNSLKVTSSTVVEDGATIRCGRTLIRVVDDITSYQRFPLSSDLVVGGPSIAEVRAEIRILGPLAQPVLIEGDSGTAKEAVAEALHRLSGRRGEFGSFCCSTTAGLMETELFGDPSSSRVGLLRETNQGTLFIDDLDELPMAAQARLVAMMDRHAAGDPLMDVRVIGGTHTSLSALTDMQRFNAQLVHRIGPHRIRLPELRKRREDIPFLVSHLLLAGPIPFSVEAMERLLLWQWPDNERELANVVLVAAGRARTSHRSMVGIEHLPRLSTNHLTPPSGQVHPTLRNGKAACPTHDSTLPDDCSNSQDSTLRTNREVVTATLRTRIEASLTKSRGDVELAAQELGCGRPWLNQLLRRLMIDPQMFKK